MHHLAGRVSWWSQLRAAVHREIANLFDTGGNKVQVTPVCVCVVCVCMCLCVHLDRVYFVIIDGQTTEVTPGEGWSIFF